MTKLSTLPRGYVGTAVASFQSLEIAIAFAVAFIIEFFFFTVLVSAGNTARIQERDVSEPKPIPIAVKPVLDDAPLLKLGGKRVKAKLPDMWKKQAPVPVYEAKSAPSPNAENRPEAIPTTEVAKGDAEAPPPDAEVVAKVEESLMPEAGADAGEANLEGEGSAAGVKEGTETDPLKGRAVSEYQMKILGWFNARFHPPGTGAPCAELKRLTAAAAVTVGSDRSVMAYVLTRPSGNATFDDRVRADLGSMVGQQLPPPPPLYPDILGTTVYPVFSGSNAPCASSPSPPSSASP